MWYIVYKTTNLINGKIYVGKHAQQIDPYLFDGYLGSGSILGKAIKKYGVDKFVRETLFAFGDDIGSCFLKEFEEVDKHLGQKYCYNQRRGGIGGFEHWNNGSKEHIEATRRGGKTACTNLNKFMREQKLLNTKWWQDYHAKVVAANIKNSIKAQTPKARAKRIKTFEDIKHQQGNSNSQFGTRVFVDPGITRLPNIKILNSQRYLPGNQPQGWIEVTEWRDSKKNKSQAAYGRHWYNDGTKNHYLYPTDELITELNLVKKRLNINKCCSFTK